MTREASRLLEEALHLNANDRAKLAAELLASLDADGEDVRAAWAAEIARRSAAPFTGFPIRMSDRCR